MSNDSKKEMNQLPLPKPDADSAEITKALLSQIPDYDDNFTIEMIIQKILKEDRQYDLSKIISAYEFAAKAHEGQKRSSGQDYIIHPLAVAYILLELGMDTDTICAALLLQLHNFRFPTAAACQLPVCRGGANGRPGNIPVYSPAFPIRIIDFDPGLYIV